MNNRDMKSEIALSAETMTALLDPREVSAVLKVPVKAVHKLVREGKLPCVQVTGCWVSYCTV
jgi:hypothetical protein